MTQDATILALDVGGKRIGVALASLQAKIPSPRGVLLQSEQTIQDIQTLVDDNNAQAIVVGLPRGLNGQETQQTATIRQFVEKLTVHSTVPIHLQDEALTSHKAKEELEARGKEYQKGDVDALAATYILEDYLGEHGAEYK